MNVFGLLNVQDAAEAAMQKFHACPWHFFDGVPDHAPNALLWSDFAITRIMSSGLRQDLIDAALSRVRAAEGESTLGMIPVEYDLILDETESEQIYLAVDQLFAIIVGDHFRISRASKVLCRKRPRSIPMMDQVVTNFLISVCKHWRSNPDEAPAWFAERWKTWTVEPSPYLRMIRHEARQHLAELEDIRRQLASDADTGVPTNAALLRIWEAIVFWSLLPHGGTQPQRADRTGGNEVSTSDPSESERAATP